MEWIIKYTDKKKCLIYDNNHLFVFNYNGYYSSDSNKYIKLIFNSNNIVEDEFYLKLGLNIAIITNSIFIFPLFKCNHCIGYCKYF